MSHLLLENHALRILKFSRSASYVPDDLSPPFPDCSLRRLLFLTYFTHFHSFGASQPFSCQPHRCVFLHSLLVSAPFPTSCTRPLPVQGNPELLSHHIDFSCRSLSNSSGHLASGTATVFIPSGSPSVNNSHPWSWEFLHRCGSFTSQRRC